MQRRSFIGSSLTGAGVALVQGSSLGKIFHPESSTLACQHYSWFTFMKREGKEWLKDVDASFQAFLESGYSVFEPSFEDVEDVLKLKPILEKYKITLKSFYVNSVLHDPKKVEASVAKVLDIARVAKSLGAELVVTNPSPIEWGSPANKTDKQIAFQAKALDDLGRELKSLGLTLAYHSHDAEMRMGAREFHHMMTGTDAANVSLCLDAHWVFRGTGDSQVALFDIVELYADRVVELHIRQSQDGIWSETFGKGDIDYIRLAKVFSTSDRKLHVVMEQAVEQGTPYDMDAVSALGESKKYAQGVFEQLL